jgi:hypothetical protein
MSVWEHFQRTELFRPRLEIRRRHHHCLCSASLPNGGGAIGGIGRIFSRTLELARPRFQRRRTGVNTIETIVMVSVASDEVIPAESVEVVHVDRKRF